MVFLTPDRADDISRRLAQAESLDAVLDVLGEQIAAMKLAEGYLINLTDASGSNLVSLKVSFPGEFRSLEQTTIGRHNPVSDGYLNSRVFQTRSIQSVHIGNASEHERMVLQYWRAKEIVGVPILHPRHQDQAPIGAVVLIEQKDRIDLNTLAPLHEVLRFMYASLSIWLRYSHLDDMREQAAAAVTENQRLLQFLNDMNSLNSVDMIYDMFAAKLLPQLSFDLAAFSLVENDRLVIQKVCTARPELEGMAAEWLIYLQQNPFPLDPSVSGTVLVLSEDKEMLFSDLQALSSMLMAEHDRNVMHILKSPRSLFISPIRHQKKPIGIFVLYSLDNSVSLSEADTHLLQQLSSFLGTAITSSQTYAISQAQNLEIGHLNDMLQGKVKELAEQASTDRLTGLLNFRSYEREMAKRIKECQRSDSKDAFSLALIDIDHFKRFNDTYGHAAGNDVLAGVAAEISKVIRASDTAFRYGGEEFVVTLPKCDLQGALLLAERIRAAIEAASHQTEGGARNVTVSIGCTVYQPGDTQDTLFARADQALYAAKGQGRNRVCSA